MKNYTTLYYLLFVLLILGAFASMAQNSYGMVLLGSVAGLFSILFFYQLFESLNIKGKKNILIVAEFLCLGIMALLITLRIFNIYLPPAEILFTLAGLALAIIYMSKIFSTQRALKNKGISMTLPVMAYYASLGFFFLSLIAFTMLPLPSFIMGVTAFMLLVLFLIITVVKKETIIEGESFSLVKVIKGMKDQSIILLSLFFIFTLYIGLSNASILPKLYTDQFPQAYYGLLRDADTRKELPVNGMYRHDAFKKNYVAFVNKHAKD